MRSIILIVCLLLSVGCARREPLGEFAEPTEQGASIASRGYTVLSAPPDSTLVGIGNKVVSDKRDPTHQLLEQFATSSLNGQRAVSMLELACYADVMCHSVEFSLREATIAFIRGNFDSPGVREAIKWIHDEYESQLPLDAPGDEAGHFRGVLVQSMKIRMTEYAKELLQAEAAARDSK